MGKQFKVTENKVNEPVELSVKEKLERKKIAHEEKTRIDKAAEDYKSIDIQTEFNLADYYRPLKNQVVLDLTPAKKKSDLIIIDESDPQIKEDLYFPVVCTGPQITDIKVGDFIMLRPDVMAPILNILGRKFSQINEFDCMGIMSKEMVEMDKKYKKEKAIRKKLLTPTKSASSIVGGLS